MFASLDFGKKIVNNAENHNLFRRLPLSSYTYQYVKYSPKFVTFLLFYFRQFREGVFWQFRDVPRKVFFIDKNPFSRGVIALVYGRVFELRQWLMYEKVSIVIFYPIPRAKFSCVQTPARVQSARRLPYSENRQKWHHWNTYHGAQRARKCTRKKIIRFSNFNTNRCLSIIELFSHLQNLQR